MTQKIKITVPKKFAGLFSPNYRYYVYHGGRGSAKSHSIARYLIAAAMSQPLKILCARELQSSIADSVHKLLSDVISLYKLGAWFNVGKAEITCVNGSSFIFKGIAFNVDSIKSTEAVDICWLEEADRVTQNSWDIIIPTIRKPGSKFIVSFNPTNDDDPVYKMFVTTPHPQALVTEVNWRDNKHLSQELIKEKNYMMETDYEKYLHVWEGKTRTVSDAQIFKGKFVVQEFSSEGVNAFYHGMDFGFSKDPSVVIRCFIKDQNLYIDKEGYGHGVELSELPALMNSVLASRHYKILADCARPETISHLANLEGGGYNIKGAKKWSGSVEDGIEFLKSFRKIVIHPSCPNTIKEFQKYSFKIDKHTNEVLPIVVDDWNHCIDSLRYALDDMIKHKASIYDAGFV